MLDPRAVACFGIGSAAPVSARLGLWDAGVPAAPGLAWHAIRLPGVRRRRSLHRRDDDIILLKPWH